MRTSFLGRPLAAALLGIGLLLVVPASGRAAEAFNGRTPFKPAGVAANPVGNLPAVNPGDFRSVLLQAINQLLGLVMIEKQMGARVPGLDRALADMVDALIGRHVRPYWAHYHHHRHHWHRWYQAWTPWHHHHHRHHAAHHHHRHRFMTGLTAAGGKNPTKTNPTTTDPAKTTPGAVLKKPATGGNKLLGQIGAGVGQTKKPARGGVALATPTRPGAGVGGLSKPTRPQPVLTRPLPNKAVTGLTGAKLRGATNLFAAHQMSRMQTAHIARAKGAAGLHSLGGTGLKAGLARRR